MEFKNEKLSNGLALIGGVNKSAKSAAVGFFVKTGSRDEAPAISGVSHYLEHMLFKGTEKLSALEVNEAFAVVTMAVMRELDIPAEKMNINGGACALGHPIGASGARIIVTLLNALRQNGLKTGLASLCIGGGEATAIAVELIS